MPRRRNEDETTLHWSQKQKEELLLRIVDYNRKYHGRKPAAKTWEDWAKELQEHFNDPVTPAKVQQMMRRLKGKFDKELLLRTNTGLGWDPVTGSVTCSAEYWEDFAKNKKWANGARNQPLCNWDMYYDAFGSTRANWGYETGMERTPPEADKNVPELDEDNEGPATSPSLGSDDGFVTMLRAGLKDASRGLNIASSSRAIGKKAARSSRRNFGDPEAKELIGRLVSSIESKNSSRATSFGTNQRLTNPLMRECQDIAKELELDDETSVTFLEAIGWFPHMQQLFVDMTKSQRALFVTKIVTGKSNASTPGFSVPQAGVPPNFLSSPFSNFMAAGSMPQPQGPYFGQAPPNFPHPPSYFGQAPPNFGPPPSNFGQQVPNFGQHQVPPNFARSPNRNPQAPTNQNMSQNVNPPTTNYTLHPGYYMPNFPPTTGQFGGDVDGDQL